MLYVIITAFAVCLIGVVSSILWEAYTEYKAWKKSQAKRKD